MIAELELPLVSLDEIIFDTLAADLVLINRLPAPGETDVPADVLIQFDIVDTSGSAPNTAVTQVYVTVGAGPEVLAYDGGAGGFQVGWAGPESVVGTPYPEARTFFIDTTLGPFPSLEVITIRVVTANLAATAVLDESYTFTIEDLTAPILTGAVSNDKTTVRVIFDETVKMADATATDDALNPANYLIERLNVYPQPAVNVNVGLVTMISSQEVELELDIEISPDQPYRVTVSGVEDVFGNAIVAPFNMQDFIGFRPARPPTRRFNYFEMLPDVNRDEDITQELEAFALSIQDVIDLLLCLIDTWTDILDVDKAPEAYLDAMLCDLGNPFDFDLTENDKRRLIRILVDIYKQKGTAIGIQNVIRFFLGLEVVINSFGSEGWTIGVDELGETTILGPGSQFNLYAFEILVPVTITAEQESRIRELAEYMKPAHTHLVRIVSPTTPAVIMHLELGLSLLGETWILH